MRLARVRTPEGPVSGRYEDGSVVTGDGEYEVGRDGHLLPPADPSAIYCTGRNYGDKLAQMGSDRPDAPDFFVKPPASLLAHGEPIRYPRFAGELTYAGELAAVVDRRCRNLSPAAVPEAIRGYTVLNDVDAVDQPRRSPRKVFDGSAPLGPWLETDVDPADVEMWTDVGGERRQEATTASMLFDPRTVVASLSERVTLRPDDVISFGSPENPGLVEPGEAVEITYEGVGTLRNEVVDPDGDASGTP